MKLIIPDGLVQFSTEFSRFKTPAVRTQGWEEQAHEVRGEGDMLDTLGSLMLWRFLAEHNVPVTYLLTGRQGDDADLQVKFRHPEGEARLLNINVKTSKFDRGDEGDPCIGGHLAIKQVEFNKTVSDVYAQVFVHLESSEEPHVHLCGWVGKKSKTFKLQQLQEIPGTSGTEGLWIPCADLEPMEKFIVLVQVK